MKRCALLVTTAAIAASACAPRNEPPPSTIALPPAYTPTPSATIVPADTPTANYPPAEHTPIDASNAADLRLLARIGYGVPEHLVWSADGSTFAVSTSTGAFIFHEGQSQPVREIDTPSPVRAIALSPNGEVLAMSHCLLPEDDIRFCARGKIAIWRPSDPAPETEFEVAPGQPYALAFTPDGSALASVGCAQADLEYPLCTEGSVTLYDSSTWRVLNSFRAHQGTVLDIAFSLDGKSLATAGEDGKARLWSRAGALLNTFVPECLDPLIAHPIRDVAFSPDGLLLAGGTCGAATIWRVGSGAQVERVGDYGEDVVSLSFSPDGRFLVTGGGTEDGRVALWNLETMSLEYESRPAGVWVSTAAFSPDGETFATVDYVNGVLFRDASSGLPTTSVTPSWRYSRTVTVDPQGTIIAVVTSGGVVEEREARSGELETAYLSLGQYVYSIAFRDDGSLIALTCDEGEIRVRDVRTGDTLNSTPSGLDLCEPNIMTKLSPNGSYAVLAFWRAHGWRLWDLSNDRVLRHGEPMSPQATVFTRDGTHLAILATSVQLYDMDGNLALDTDRDPSHDLGNVFDLALSEDSRQYAIGGYELFHDQLKEFSTPRSFEPGTSGDMARAVAISHGADLVAASIYPIETATALFDARTGRRIIALPHHMTDGWPHLEFSPDGSLLFDFSEAGTILVWGLKE